MINDPKYWSQHHPLRILGFLDRMDFTAVQPVFNPSSQFVPQLELYSQLQLSLCSDPIVKSICLQLMAINEELSNCLFTVFFCLVLGKEVQVTVQSCIQFFLNQFTQYEGQKKSNLILLWNVVGGRVGYQAWQDFCCVW